MNPNFLFELQRMREALAAFEQGLRSGRIGADALQDLYNEVATSREGVPAHLEQPYRERMARLQKAAGSRERLILVLTFTIGVLIVVGFYMDDSLFQVPAAASIFIFFATMTAVIGSLTYFLQSWSLPFIIVLLFIINILYEREIIDPRNKAYGLNYMNTDERPGYDKQSLLQLCVPEKIKADRVNMIAILENWKKKQKEEKPVSILKKVQ